MSDDLPAAVAAVVGEALALALPSLADAASTGGSAAAAGAADPTRLAEELRRTRMLVAAGERALGLRHALNNPLAALVAEVQLLQLDESLDREHRAAAARMLELCRRLVQVVRRLDAEEEAAAPGAPEGAGGPRAARSSHTHGPGEGGGSPGDGSDTPGGAYA